MSRQTQFWTGVGAWSTSVVVVGCGAMGHSTLGNDSSRAGAREVVRCAEIAFSRSVEMRDAAYFASFVDEDARFINDTVIRGPSAMLEAWAPFFDETGPKIQWRPYYIEIAETGDLAFSRGPFRIRGVRDNGQTYESWGIYNSVWRKTGDASWNLIFDAGNQGENQLIEPMKKFIDEPVKNCDFQLDRKKRLG